MTTKTTRIVSIILMAIPTLVMIIGGIMKVIGAEPEVVMQFLSKSGFGDYIFLLGMSELIIAALIIYPRTNKTGFLLATAYFGGALSLEIGGSQPPASAIFLTLLWISMFLKDRHLFLSSAPEK